jgi:hypothetical protein
LPDPQLAPSTAKSGKNRIRKTEINFKGRPQKFLGSFFLSQILGWPLMSPGEALQRGYGLAELARWSAVLFVERFLQCKMTAVRSWSRSQEPDRLSGGANHPPG